MKTKNLIPIFFTIDDAYAPLLGVALKSIIINASKERNYKVIVIQENVSDENQRKLLALANENFDIEVMPMRRSLENITDRSENRLRCDYFTMTIFFRLFIPEMFPEYDKALYLDSDIVVPGDISELYDTNVEGHLFAACPDYSSSDVPALIHWMENAIGVDRDKYVNSGIMVMNLKKLREVKLEEHFMHLLNTYHFNCIAPDQDYLNAMCKGQILFLDEAWDVMPNPRKKEHPAPKLIHYNLFEKPWCYDNIQYADYFWKYAEMSDFHDQVKAIKENYSAEQKARDKQSFNLLLKKAETVPDTGVTFVKMANKDVKIKL
ncbi:MAG: glycosyltransferase family 8 protein [Bacteroidota bacterium]|jgi:lipopolysaccharide biosynthesis glycosyltransferase|nr:glycosyltransferase family 8 protein [Bacteroidota bacterium]HHU97383.1 glycosyltransferase family 8 protein [Petrimonas sp.]